MRRTMALILLSIAGCAPSQLAVRPAVGIYEYRLGSGDKLRVVTYGEQRLSGDFAVDAHGRVQFPLLGEVEAGGRTIDQFKAELLQRLGAELLRNPEVTVEMLNFRPVYLLGEVARPGEYPFSDKLSFYALVAKAGGYTFRANRSFAYIRSEGEAAEQPVRIDSATAVMPGDTIRVPESTF